MNIKKIKNRKKIQIGKIRLTLMAEWCSSALWYKSNSKNGMIEIEKLPKEIHILKDEIKQWNDQWMEIASIGLNSWFNEDEIKDLEEMVIKIEQEQQDIDYEEIERLRKLNNKKGYEIAYKIKELLKFKKFDICYYDEILQERILIK